MCVLELDELIQSKMLREESGHWACLSCDYRRPNRGDVANHVEARHVDYSAVACNICGFVTKTRKALKMHKFRQHSKKSEGLQSAGNW
jgi:hypothetical protein